MSRLRPWRTRLLVAAAMVTLVGVAVLGGRPAGEDPLDPTSTASDGLRGVLDLLERHGVHTEVSLELPVDMSTTIWVPLDRLTARHRDALGAWVEDGGRLVVTDPTSPLHGLDPASGGLIDTVGPTARVAGPACALLPDAVETVTHAAWNRYEVPDDASACFVLDGHGWLVARRVGEGEIIALGSAEPFTNARLGQADHAVLAAAVLAPSPGDALVVVPRAPVGEGDTALLDLVPHRFWHGLALLLGACLLGALALGRRHGRPVVEELPPVLPARHFVTSLADLWQRAGRPAATAVRLRSGLRYDVARAMGVEADSPSLARLASDRLGVPIEVADTALGQAVVRDEGDLLALARAVRIVRVALRAGAPVSLSSGR